MLNFVKKHRGLPLVKRGTRILHTHNNKKGRVASGNDSGNFNIIFDGEKKSINCHPHYKMIYYDKEGKILYDYSN